MSYSLDLFKLLDEAEMVEFDPSNFQPLGTPEEVARQLQREFPNLIWKPWGPDERFCLLEPETGLGELQFSLDGNGQVIMISVAHFDLNMVKTVAEHTGLLIFDPQEAQIIELSDLNES